MNVLRSGSATDQGRVRPSNQDRMLVTPHLVAVADGMGGHNGGEVAASTAVSALLENFGARGSSDKLLEAVEMANAAIWEQSRREHDLRGMGTTLTALALVTDGESEQLTLVNVGDSRAYLFAERSLAQLTTDHSLVEEMVRQGELTPAEAAFHPHRHILTRALGIESSVDVDAWRFEPAEGDRVLLCSDGLTNELSEEEIAEVLGAEEDPDVAAEELVRLAVGHGGNDNVTAVVVDVVNEHALAAAAPPGQRKGKAKSEGSRRQRTGRGRKQGVPTAGHTEGVTEAIPIVPAVPAAGEGAEPGGGRVGDPPGEAAPSGNGAGEVPAGIGAGAAPSGDGAGEEPEPPGLDSGAPTRAMLGDESPETTILPGVRGSSLPDLGARPRSPERIPDLTSNGSYRTGSDVAERRRAAAKARRGLRSSGAAGSEPPLLAPSGAEVVAAPAAGAAGSVVDLDGGPGGRPVVLVARSGRERGGRTERIVTMRVILYAVLLVGLLGGVAGTVGWYVQNAYYVTLNRGEVVIYHGHIGGMLWFQPSLIQHTGITTKQVIPPLLPALKKGVQETSLAAAEAYVQTLSKDQGLLQLFSTTTTVPASTIPGVNGTTTTASPVPSTQVPQTTAPPSTFVPATTAPANTTTTSPSTTTTAPPPPSSTAAPPPTTAPKKKGH